MIVYAWSRSPRRPRSNITGGIFALLLGRLENVGGGNSNPESFQADIVALACRQQPDGGDPKILENLGAQSYFQPFAFAGLRFVVAFVPVFTRACGLGYADANGAFAQVDDNAAALFGDAIHDRIELTVLAEHIGADIFQMQAHRDIDAVADIAEDDGEVLHRVPGQGIGMALALP